jgi:hypothetical protein
MHFPHAVKEPAMVIGAGRGVHKNNRNLIEPLIVSTPQNFSLCADPRENSPFYGNRADL